MYIKNFVYTLYIKNIDNFFLYNRNFTTKLEFIVDINDKCDSCTNLKNPSDAEKHDNNRIQKNHILNQLMKFLLSIGTKKYLQIFKL